MNLDSMHFIGIEKRLIWFKFEEDLTVNSNGIRISNNYPIGIEFNIDLNETYIWTKFDIRCLNTLTGKILRIVVPHVSNFIFLLIKIF